jgi:hypothetical protein
MAMPELVSSLEAACVNPLIQKLNRKGNQEQRKYHGMNRYTFPIPIIYSRLNCVFPSRPLRTPQGGIEMNP